MDDVKTNEYFLSIQAPSKTSICVKPLFVQTMHTGFCPESLHFHSQLMNREWSSGELDMIKVCKGQVKCDLGIYIGSNNLLPFQDRSLFRRLIIACHIESYHMINMS